MQQAIERLRKTVRSYVAGETARAVAVIELVSAFKVVCKNADVDPDNYQNDIATYIEAILSHLDNRKLTEEEVIEEVSRIYEAAHTRQPNIGKYISEYSNNS